MKQNNNNIKNQINKRILNIYIYMLMGAISARRICKFACLVGGNIAHLGGQEKRGKCILDLAAFLLVMAGLLESGPFHDKSPIR